MCWLALLLVAETMICDNDTVMMIRRKSERRASGVERRGKVRPLDSSTNLNQTKKPVLTLIVWKGGGTCEGM